MSLQVWLPLTGDLHNQGLGQITSISGTPSYKANGKIGKSALDLKTRITFVCPQLANLQTFSICFWGLTSSSSSLTTTWADLLGFTDISSGGTTGTFRWETCYNGSNSGIHWHDNATNAIVNGSHNHNTVKDVWVHCCIVVDAVANKLYSYDNGILTQTHNLSGGGTFNTTGTFYLGEANKLEGMIQDVRIYDHALSIKEVEEIAKGLVLHYPLNQGNSNQLENIPKSVSSGSYCAYQLNLTENLVANETYTLQLWDVDVYHSAKTAAQTGVWIYWGGGSIHLFNWAGPTYFTKENDTNYHADYLEKTFTVTSANASGSGAANAWFNVYNSVGNADGTRNMHIGAWKLEKGSAATNLQTMTNKIIYDCSGYSHNGTIIGNLTAITPSPRYDSATKFSTINDYFYMPHLVDSSSMMNEFTFSCWLYRDYTDATTRTFYYGLCKIYLYTDFKARITWTHASTDLSYNSTNTWAPGILIPLQEWTHIAFTFKDGILYHYVNGVQYGPSDRSNNGQFIYGTQGSPNASIGYDWIGQISDVRTYATALTAAQIKELYNTSMSIDSNGNVYARQLVS